ncbi:MAG: TlpA family protein disulfide reductase [Chloroflexi bacterium]|nr:TlpA family protein disulfide reductase [Chloroflexota bacterium]NOG37349.1 TlpA family protein disulfide reductase [Chloroflexota bacterium]
METFLLFSVILLWLLVLLNIVMTIGLARRIKSQLPPPIEFLKAGQPAPPFTAWTLAGTQVTDQDYAGQSIAFVFLSPHCQPCREEIPHLAALQPRARQAGITLLLVSDSSEQEAQTFVDELQLELSMLIAPRNRTRFLSDYKASVTPSFCLVDTQGNIKAAGPGMSNLAQQIEMMFPGANGGDGMG